jgi:hypothetical protein
LPSTPAIVHTQDIITFNCSSASKVTKCLLYPPCNLSSLPILAV